MPAYLLPWCMVSCDKTDHKAEQFLSNPSIIVEVLSDSTEAYDRGTKFAAYRRLSKWIFLSNFIGFNNYNFYQ